MKTAQEIISGIALGPGWEDRWFAALNVELTHLNYENTQLRLELTEAVQRNDLFSKCTARALTLWQQKHPDSRAWPDTAENLCWLAEENERLQAEFAEFKTYYEDAPDSLHRRD